MKRILAGTGGISLIFGVIVTLGENPAWASAFGYGLGHVVAISFIVWIFVLPIGLIIRWMLQRG